MLNYIEMSVACDDTLHNISAKTLMPEFKWVDMVLGELDCTWFDIICLYVNGAKIFWDAGDNEIGFNNKEISSLQTMNYSHNIFVK